MQTLQWGVSRPEYMDALVAIVPLAKTPAWGVAVVEASRKAIMEDPGWKDGNYDAPPEKGVRLWRDIVNLLAARTPEMYSAQFKNPIDVLPWLTEQENAMMKAFDANDWIYQGWAYERHDVGGTAGFDGDTAKALASVKAKTLILTGTKDLLNPDFEPKEAAKNIANIKVVTISPGTVRGHASAGGFNPADVDQSSGRGVSQPRGLRLFWMTSLKAKKSYNSNKGHHLGHHVIALLRLIELYHPTMLIDEIHALMSAWSCFPALPGRGGSLRQRQDSAKTRRDPRRTAMCRRNARRPLRSIRASWPREPAFRGSRGHGPRRSRRAPRQRRGSRRASLWPPKVGQARNIVVSKPQ
jgi:hypothetical protein